MISEKILNEVKITPGPAIVIDAGSWVKCGLAGEDGPKVMTPAVVAAFPPELETYAQAHGPFVGYNAFLQSSKSPSLNFNFPIECGLPVMLKDAELVLRHVIENEMRISTEGRDVILTKKSLTPKKFLRDICESMFENFRVSRLAFINSDIASLYMTGRTSGVVLDFGCSQVMITPILEGIPQMHAIRRLELGGRDITEYFQKQLESNTMVKFRSAAEVEIVRKLKEKVCVFAPNWEDPVALREAYDASEKCYELPDGHDIRIGFSRAQAPEILFHPGLSGSPLEEGLAQKLFSSIMECDINERRTLYKNIIICGGTSMIDGLASRLKAELYKIAPLSTEIEIIANEQRDQYPWIGASMMAGLPSFKSWVTREMYEASDLSDLKL